MRVINEIQTLETRKIELDEKRKYAIEVGTREEKAKQMQSLLEEARFEYEDRQQRLDQLQRDVALLSQQLSQTAMELAENSQKNDEAAGILRRLQNRRKFWKTWLVSHSIRKPASRLSWIPRRFCPAS